MPHSGRCPGGTFRCGRRRCGGSSTRPPPEPTKCAPSTSKTSILTPAEPPIRRQKGGDTAWIHWGSGTAHLLPRLLHGRDTGPVFLSERRPGPTRRRAEVNLCPTTGRARLGYDRARVLFTRHTGWELHQLRHSAATHLGEQGVPLQLIMAKTRHRNPRTAMRYIKPGAEAVAEVTALLEPPRRRG